MFTDSSGIDLQAQIAAAQTRPRNPERVKANVIFSCEQPELAAEALYEYVDTNGRRVVGPTITLARELLRCWGNVSSTMIELARTDNQSTMHTWAVDLEANVWADRRVIVPHVRDVDGIQTPVTDTRELTGLVNDITARRQRRCILDIIPSWLVNMAKAKCIETLSAIPFNEQLTDLLSDFGENYGIDTDQLVAKSGVPFEQWSVITLARLRAVFNGLDLGALIVSEEFPHQPVTAHAIDRAEIDPDLAAAATPKNTPTQAPAAPVTAEPATADTEPPADNKKPRATGTRAAKPDASGTAS